MTDSKNMSNSNINEPPAEENRISISWGRRDINELQPPLSRAQIIPQCTSLATDDDDDDDDDAAIKANIKNTKTLPPLMVQLLQLIRIQTIILQLVLQVMML